MCLLSGAVFVIEGRMIIFVMSAFFILALFMLLKTD